MRVTVACPAAFVSDAAELAMALGFSVADRRTYDQVQFEDAAGNRYACASAMVSDSFVARAMSRLGRPVWDGGRAVNMTGAARAQDADLDLPDVRELRRGLGNCLGVVVDAQHSARWSSGDRERSQIRPRTASEVHDGGARHDSELVNDQRLVRLAQLRGGQSTQVVRRTLGLENGLHASQHDAPSVAPAGLSSRKGAGPSHGG